MDVYEVADVLCNKLKALNPILYDEPNDPRLVHVHIIINCYTVIALYGTTSCCYNITVYKNIKKPTNENQCFIDYDELFKDSNIICDFDVKLKTELENAIKKIENLFNLENI